jgi:hypothetical protein
MYVLNLKCGELGKSRGRSRDVFQGKDVKEII